MAYSYRLVQTSRLWKLYSNPNSHRNLYAYQDGHQHPYQDTNCNLHCNQHTCHDSNLYTNECPNLYQYSYQHTHYYADLHSNENTDQNSHRNLYAYPGSFFYGNNYWYKSPAPLQHRLW